MNLALLFEQMIFFLFVLLILLHTYLAYCRMEGGQNLIWSKSYTETGPNP